MKQRYFFSIRFIPKHADCSLLAGRCISTMHGFTSRNKVKGSIAISFPKWSLESIGGGIAFISEEKELLIGLSFQPYLTVMKSEGLFEISDVTDVPDSLPEVRFVRNQTIGKSFLGSKKRRIKRSLVRADASGSDHIPVAEENRVLDHFHRVPISSDSSEQDFILHLQKEAVESRDEPVFNSYGFATNKEKRGTVPDISL
ncbi:type I-F CRISPR-associated endoribonuclease Cas6/Csy4 [Photobacterium kasasachensis]|uniref:type I-F CRISPR-associated endoribonuclease Cas6/Csy4 n=1 Tax=Photobacterium kasasachensis TaxID=2910240 RepID=UPI003D0EF493